MNDKRISVIGLGKLGICAALAFEKSGYRVLGYDINYRLVTQINDKTLQSTEDGVMEHLKESKEFKATISLDRLIKFSSILFIYVDTPSSSENKGYDHSKLSKVLSNINSYQLNDLHIIIGCTIQPGYISEIAELLLQDCPGVSITYNPLFIAQGSILRDLLEPDLVLIGGQNRTEELKTFYKEVCVNEPFFRIMSHQSAEITKLALNCFITTKIAFANLISDVAKNTKGAKGKDILEAIGCDSRISRKSLKPGYGFGGPCFPRDNLALADYISSIGLTPAIPLATQTSNEKHAQVMAGMIVKKTHPPYTFKNLAYKPGVQIIEQSQKLEVARILAGSGFKVVLCDTETIISQIQRKYGKLFEYKIIR